MNTFIRAAEIWVPDADGYLLEFGGGLYGNAPEFGAVSKNMCFGRGEGLPGRVWEEGRPVVLQDLQGGFFQRAAAARNAGLACAVAFPVFFGELLKAVVVLFCGSPEGLSGAIEVWCHDPAAGGAAELHLADGVYGAREAGFEAASRETRLPRGTGLAGLAWQRSASVFIDKLADSPDFARAAALATTGLERGLAIPCPVPTPQTYVLTFLSAPRTPIARRIESWIAASGTGSLQLADGVDETLGRLNAGEALADGDIGSPPVFEAFAGGVPRLQVGGGGSAGRASPVIAFPVVQGGVVAEAVALYL